MDMVVTERKKMEATACNSRTGWSSSPLASVYCGTLDDPLVEKVPVIVPCYNGKSLDLHEELVMNGLSAISIRHPKGNCGEYPADANAQTLRKKVEKLTESKSKGNKHSESKSDNMRKCSGTSLPICLRENMKKRNSFWNVHRPELSKLTWPQNFISSAMLQDFFHYHLRTHGTFCEPLHSETDLKLVLDEESNEYALLRELVAPTVLPPDEKAVNIMEKSRSVQLNDEDLDPEIVVHKSRAEFCMTIGEYVRKLFLKRCVSHQMPKWSTYLTIPDLSQREKEEINDSSVIGNSPGQFSPFNATNVFTKRMVSTGGLSNEDHANTSSSHINSTANKIQNGGDFTTDSKDKFETK